MTALVVLCVTVGVVVLVVTLCATVRPAAGEAIATALRALASVVAAARSGPRQ